MLVYPALLLFSITVVWPGVLSASPAPLRGVRFGWHGAYARVVFDLQDDTEYRLRPGSETESIRIEFPNLHRLPSRALWKSRNPLVRAVRFSTASNMLIGKLVLNRPGTVQRHFRLGHPPRIVVDLRRRSPSVPPQTGAVSDKSTRLDGEKRPTHSHQASSPPRNPAPSPVSTVTSEREAQAGQSPVNPAASVDKLQTLTRHQLLQYAEGQWKQGQLAAAYASYQKFAERFPDYKHTHFIMVRLADILQQQGRLEAALQAYVDVITTYPKAEGAIISKMRMAELGALSPGLLPDSEDRRFEPYRHPMQTLQDLIRAMPLSPLANIARFKIGEIQLHRGQPQAALESFRTLFRYKLQSDLLQDVRPQFATALEQLLVAKVKEGAFLDVLHTYFANRQHLAPEAVTHVSLLLPVATSYAGLGLLPEAERILASLVDRTMTAEQKTAVALEQARVLSKRGRIAEALDLLEPVVSGAESPQQKTVLQTVGDLAIRAKHPAKAIGYLEMALSQASTAAARVPILVRLADGYLAQGDTRRGLRILQECAALRHEAADTPPAESENCALRAARLLLSVGQPQQALKTYQALFEAFPRTDYRNQMLYAMAGIYQQRGDEEQMLKTLQTLRDSTTSTLWKKAAADAMAQQEWQQQFGQRLAALRQPPRH